MPQGHNVINLQFIPISAYSVVQTEPPKTVREQQSSLGGHSQTEIKNEWFILAGLMAAQWILTGNKITKEKWSDYKTGICIEKWHTGVRTSAMGHSLSPPFILGKKEWDKVNRLSWHWAAPRIWLPLRSEFTIYTQNGPICCSECRELNILPPCPRSPPKPQQPQGHSNLHSTTYDLEAEKRWNSCTLPPGQDPWLVDATGGIESHHTRCLWSRESLHI